MPALLGIALLLLAGFVQAQQQGQYRSRILLDPLGEMGKGSEMSVSELEQQIDSIDDPYARSSANRFLARHYVQQKDYAGAVAYYRQALAARGLSDVANREMLRELAQVYLLQENYREAAATLQRVLDIDLLPQTADFLLLAQAHYRLKDFVAVVVALDGVAANGLRMDVPQMRQALALYYRAGAYEQCEDILQQLLIIEPANAENWHQLASVYLQQNKRRAALDQLSLALEKRIPFTEAEMQLFIDLQAINGNPYGAAALLERAMAEGIVAGNSANQRKLFELWLQARERDRARTALQSAAQSSGDTELYLYLAQLQMEDEQWQVMLDTVLASCSQQLQDRYVSRANLLLGVSLFKQGREQEARRAFINATLVGGANAQAGEWLRFMDAAPATEDEMRRVRGPCYGSEGKQDELAPAAVAMTPAEQPRGAEVADAPQPQITVKTLEPQRYYYISQDKSLGELLPEVKALAIRLNVSMVKAGGSADGPVSLLSLPGEDLRLALPTRGSPQARGRYRVYRSGQFKSASLLLEPGDSDPQATVVAFGERVQAAGYRLTGEHRLLFHSGDTPAIELQLGVE